MTKKQIALTIALFSVITCLVLYFIYLFYFKDSIQNSTSTNGAIISSDTKTLEQGKSDTISLEPKAENSLEDSGLKVDSSSNSSANLGSGNGSYNVSSSSGTTANNSQDFSKYEQYKDKTEVYFGDIKVGDGAVAQKDSQLAVTYVGYLTNGQVFDKSKPGNNGQLQPLMFKLGAGQLIPGFEQGVAGMKAGGSRRVIIPPSLGYGDKAQGGIPANSVLVFDISLVAVQ